MAIPQHTIDQILDRTDIVDVIGQFVKLKKTGRTYSGCCPFHQEKSPSFHVYRDKQYFHCFGCQANGNAIRFLMDISSRNFVEVMKDLSSQTGIELPKDDQAGKRVLYKRREAAPVAQPSVAAAPTHDVSFEDAYSDFLSQSPDDVYLDFETSATSSAPIEQEGNLFDLLENIANFYQAQLPRSLAAQQYFQKRGLTDETIAYWRLGYAPEDWQHLEKAFPQDIEGLKLLGLIRTSDSGRDFDLLRDRVIFPIRDHKGRVVGFGGRALNDDIKPKYINSPDSEVFHKNQLLYGLYEGRKQKAEQWLMVEGYMDVIALQQYGISGAVATLGTASNTEHLNLLFKQQPSITIAFDGDAAGQKAARRTLEIALPLLEDGRELKFFVLPADHDPDSLIRREGVDQFRKLWRDSPLMSQFIFALLIQGQDTQSPEGKSQIMAELRQLTELLPKFGSYRYLLQQYFREKLGFSKKWQPKQSPDASLSFSTKVHAEEYVVAILMQHPYLYRHFVSLLELMPTEQLLPKVLHVLQQVIADLPDDADLAHYYALGACADYHFDLQRILPNVNLTDYSESPEQVEKLAADLSLKLQYQYLNQRIKLRQFSSLSEMNSMKKRLYELDCKRSNTLISD